MQDFKFMVWNMWIFGIQTENLPLLFWKFDVVGCPESGPDLCWENMVVLVSRTGDERKLVILGRNSELNKGSCSWEVSFHTNIAEGLILVSLWNFYSISSPHLWHSRQHSTLISSYWVKHSSRHPRTYFLIGASQWMPLAVWQPFYPHLNLSRLNW